MKKLLLSFLFIVFAFSSMELKAGTVSIDTTNVIVRDPCNLSSPVAFNIGGPETGYNPYDTLQVFYDFGDGHSDSGFAFVDTNNRFFGSFFHIYSNSGQYTVRFIVQAPDMAADTLVLQNAVVLPDSCGNIKGRVYEDLNSDCTFNGSDSVLYGMRVDAILNGQIAYSTWTDTAGYYSIEAPASQTYTLEINNMHGYSTVCPSGGSHTVSTLPSAGNDFALSCGGGFDVSGHFTGRSIPGQTMSTHLRAFNSLCSPQSGTVKIVFDDPLYSYGGNSSPMHSAINGDTVEFDFTNLNFRHNASFTLSTYTETTAQIGDTICVTVIAEPIAADTNPSNNITEFCFPVRTSYDPNIKEVQPLGVGNVGNIAADKDLTYTIHFQNTGTAKAFNIYILDTLDTSVLDPTTIEILGSSHDMKTDLNAANQNILRFRFDDIDLPDSNSNEPLSHGWVTYHIAQQAGLTDGKKIQGSASIYFDYNPAIITNTTLNTIDNRIVGIETVGDVENQFARCYPNPTSDLLNVTIDKSKNSTVDINIYNINGQLLQQIKSEKKSQQINVSNFSRGIYFLEIKTEDGRRQTNKFVVGQ